MTVLGNAGCLPFRGRNHSSIFEKCTVKNDEFETDLNCAFANEDILQAWKWQGDFRVSKGSSVIERMNGMVSERIICFQSGVSSLEEADNRLVLHIRDSIQISGHNNIIVRSLDSDVIVILIGFYFQFLVYHRDCEVTLEFGSSSNKQYISIRDCF